MMYKFALLMFSIFFIPDVLCSGDSNSQKTVQNESFIGTVAASTLRFLEGSEPIPERTPTVLPQNMASSIPNSDVNSSEKSNTETQNAQLAIENNIKNNYNSKYMACGVIAFILIANYIHFVLDAKEQNEFTKLPHYQFLQNKKRCLTQILNENVP